jgi:EpsI family protein
MTRSLPLLGTMLVAAAAAALLTPQREAEAPAASLDDLVPLSFGEWRAVPDPVAQVTLNPRLENEPAGAQAYDDLMVRTYRRADGQEVMVTLAYGRRQTQELKIHRPELCYYAQGFEVLALGPRTVRLSPSQDIRSLTLLTRNRARVEVVTYWMRIGAQVTENAWQTRWVILREGLRGRIPDGMLVRASTLASPERTMEEVIELQQAFLADLYSAVPASTRQLLAGA